MQRIIKFSSLGILLSMSVSACATTSAGPSGNSPQFGNAVRANIAAHAVPATPEEKANTFIPADRSRQAKAIERYKDDEVEKPHAVRTTKADGD